MNELGILYKKMNDVLKKKIPRNFRQNFQKIAFLLTASALLAEEEYFDYHVKRVDILQEN